MTNKIIMLIAATLGLSACQPYNSYYGQGYYNQGSYSNYKMPQAAYNLAQTNFEDELAEIGYSDSATLSDPYSMVSTQAPMPLQPQAPISPVGGLNQQAQQPVYYNTANASMVAGPQGVIGVGQTLAAPVAQSQVFQNQGGYAYNAKTSTLIMPDAWRIVHPSIGKGLELTNQTERFELNKALNGVTIKKPEKIILGSKNVTLIGLANASSANSQGFLCKDVYLVKSDRNDINAMWGSFCRHPNWNEWVLTKW